MTASRCRVCKTECDDMEKRFDPVLGYVCESCHGFLLYADKVLKRHGIEGVTLKPHRNAPRKEDAQ